MWTRQRKNRRIGALIVPALAIAFISYFGYHALHGEYGIYARELLVERTVQLGKELEKVRLERAQLEHRVALLRDGSVERDMLDEHARRALNVARSDEIIIFRKRPDLD